MKIYESGENYLETIYIMHKRMGAVRAVDLCAELGFSKPTVSVALKRFREDGYVTVDGDGHIALTEKGLEIAERMYERHNGIAAMLIAMGVDEETAYEDSCRIEHHISDKSFRCMQKYYEEHMRQS